VLGAFLGTEVSRYYVLVPKMKKIKFKSLVDDCVVLGRKLSRMDRIKIAEALRTVIQDLNEVYMINPEEFVKQKPHWVTKEAFESMAVARLNGMLR